LVKMLREFRMVGELMVPLPVAVSVTEIALPLLGPVMLRVTAIPPALSKLTVLPVELAASATDWLSPINTLPDVLKSRSPALTFSRLAVEVPMGPLAVDKLTVPAVKVPPVCVIPPAPAPFRTIVLLLAVPIDLAR